MYGFHKVVGLADGSLKTSEQRSKPPSEYENPYFKRGQPDLMWLISKPKGKPNKKRKNKQEPDSDKEEELSDGADGDFGSGGVLGIGGYIEGAKNEAQGDGQHQQGGRASRPDIQALIQQLDSVKNHQAMISAAINRLRKDHNQLYEQSIAFQTLHDRHEHSISAILTFLATVYDKSLGGHITGAFNNLFTQNQVEHGIQQGVGSVVGNTGGAIVTPAGTSRAVVRTPQMARRRQLLLENGPMAGQISEEDSSKQNILPANSGQNINTKGSPIIQNYQTYQSPSIQELVTPGRDGSSVRQDQQSQSSVDQNYPSPIFSIPDSPIAQSTPQMNPSRASASPVLPKGALAPRSFNRGLAPSGLSSKSIQDHNAQLARKAKEIEALEELQAAQTENVDGLMDMIQSYVGHGDDVDGINDSTGLGSSIDEYLNWVPSGDFTGDSSLGNFDLSVDGQHLDNGSDIEDLFRYDKDIQGGGVMGGNIGDSGMGQILGTNPSTVATSPAPSSVGGRPSREELEEEAEEVTPKRRRLR